jgi:bromodomain-containing factor 1
LDIDQFTNPVLSRLHDLIIKNVPGIVPPKPEPSRPAKPSKPKKNKPMSKTEQENKIEKLRKLKEQFDRQGSTSDDAAAGRVVPCK